MSKRKNPQDKKRDSYARDRRNRFGQNDKASRRLIPLHKRLAERAHRKSVRDAVHLLTGIIDEESAVLLDKRVADTRTKLVGRWRKAPGVPLAECVTPAREKGGAPHAKHLRRLRSLEDALTEARNQLARIRAEIVVLKKSCRPTQWGADEAQRFEALKEAQRHWAEVLRARQQRLQNELLEGS